MADQPREVLRAEVRRSAASPRRVSGRDRFASYWNHHREVAADSLQRLVRKPLGTLATWLVIGIALALPGALYVALDNLQGLARGWEGATRISLFLKESVDDGSGQALAARVRERTDVAGVEFISREQALAEFRALSGFGEVLDHLDQNPLPAVVLVQPAALALDAEQAQRLGEELRTLPEVERAVLDLAWLQRLFAILDLGRNLALALAAVLAVGVLLVIGNTMRLAIEARRDEILVIKLVGGTNAFVRRPFLYTGLWYGLGGAVVACLLLVAGLLWLGNPVAQLADLYASDFRLAGLGIGHVGLLLLAGGVLGWLGAWLSVGRHLSAIEPR